MRTIFADGLITSRAPLGGISYILHIVLVILIWNWVPPTLLPSQLFHLIDGVHHRPQSTPFFHHFVHHTPSLTSASTNACHVRAVAFSDILSIVTAFHTRSCTHCNGA
ncbi:hypothetical protein BDR03DRAFT_955891 [Suillus americanus]|nr:hypothetical protein BDR03DRAFT_955891 [Suillus americanus]